MNKIILIFVLVLAIGTTFSCNSNKSEKIALEKYPTTNPILVDTTFTIDHVAEIQSLQNVEIRTKINGYIEKIYVDEGKPVKAGQLLFTISSQISIDKFFPSYNILNFIYSYKNLSR